MTCPMAMKCLPNMPTCPTCLTARTGRPELVLDPDTGLYGVLVDNVEVISGLDPVGLREGIRRNASVARAHERGLRLVPTDTSPATGEGSNG